MDLRAVRTRTNIYNAFLALRAKKPLEKITVKELSQAAMINKATFYLHYQDIYDLSNQLEDQAIDQLFQGIPHPEDLLLHPAEGVATLVRGILNQGQLFHTLFSHSRQSVLIDKLERRVRELTRTRRPDFSTTLEEEIMLTVLIQGNFHAFLRYQDQDFRRVIRCLGEISQTLADHYPPEETARGCD